MITEKRKKLLKLLEPKEKQLEEFCQNYRGPGLLKKIKRLLKYHRKYLKFYLSRLISTPLKVKTFWGEDFWPLETMTLYLFGLLGDYQETRLNKFLIKNLSEKTIFYDIGANSGFYSMLVEKIIESKEIHVFEPIPTTFKYLKKNFLNSQNVFLNQIALFNKEDEIDFYDATKTGYPGISSFDGSFIDNVFAFKIKKIKVKTTTLDKYCSFHSLPTFLKIDVEGAESYVIEGGVETLTKTNPVIAMEVFNNKSHLKAIEILYSLGYKSYKINENGELIFIERLFPEKEIPKEDKFNNFIFKK